MEFLEFFDNFGEIGRILPGQAFFGAGHENFGFFEVFGLGIAAFKLFEDFEELSVLRFSQNLLPKTLLPGAHQLNRELPRDRRLILAEDLPQGEGILKLIGSGELAEAAGDVVDGEVEGRRLDRLAEPEVQPSELADQSTLQRLLPSLYILLPTASTPDITPKASNRWQLLLA